MARRWSAAASCRLHRESRRRPAPLGSAPARVRPTRHGFRTLSESLCRHRAWLELRLVLPEVCDVPKSFRPPLVGIDGVQVQFSAVVKNDHARRAPRYPLLHLVYCHKHSPRRATSENGFAAHQTATTDHTVQVRHPQTLVGQVGLEKLGASARAVSWNEPLGGLSAENDTALSINREDGGVQVVISNVLGAASERATRAGGYEEVIDPPVQFRRDLLHRSAIVRLGIGQVGILVGPEAVFDTLQEALDAIDPCLEELSRNRVGF